MNTENIFPKEKFPIRAYAVFYLPETNIIAHTEVYLNHPFVCPFLGHGMQTEFGIVRRIIFTDSVLCFAALFRRNEKRIKYFIPKDGKFAEIDPMDPEFCTLLETHNKTVGAGNEGIPLSGIFLAPDVVWKPLA